MSSFDTFIIGLSSRLYVPYDVVLLIQLYFGSHFLGWNISLFCLKESRLYNPTWNKMYSVNDAVIFDEIIPHCIVNDVSLPESIKLEYKNQFPYNCSSAISSNQWSMMFHGGTHRGYTPSSVQYRYYLTAFNADLLSSDIAAKTKYIFELPSLSKRIITPSSPPTIYNKHEGILYAANMKCLYCLHLNVATNIKPEWIKLTNNLLIERCKTSLCMLDNDRFIAILGGYKTGCRGKNNAELYAINCDKSILINNMNGEYSERDISLYHDKLHGIIICNTDWYAYDNMEWYDINKDKWMELQLSTHFTQKFREIKQIIVAEKNPNVIYIGCMAANWTIRSKYKYEIYEMDLRTDANKIKCIWKHDDGYLGLSARDICMLQM